MLSSWFGAFIYSIFNGGSTFKDSKGEWGVWKQVENTGDASATAERRFDWNGRNQGKDVAQEQAKDDFKTNQGFEQTLRECGLDVTYTQNRSESAVVKLSSLGVVPSIGNAGINISAAFKRGLPNSGPIVRSLGAASKAGMLAKKFKMNINSPTTRQILNNLDESVEFFISTYRKSSIRSEIP